MSKVLNFWLFLKSGSYYLLRLGIAHSKLYLQKVYHSLHFYKAVYFFFYLFHRYQPAQMDLRHLSHNIRLLLRVREQQGLSSSRSGKLQILSTKGQKFLFSFWNFLFFGAPASRVEKVVFYTFVTITLEHNNPFNKNVLRFFLEKKIALLYRLLRHLKKINRKVWDQSEIERHIATFHENSLLQWQVIDKMQKAVTRQREPEIIRDAKRALEKGLYPILITVGLSGAYWMRNTNRQIAGLFKPFDEEIHAPNNPIGLSHRGALGQRKTRLGCRVGEAAHHEVGAFLVDAYFGFGIVPRTYYATFTHRTFFLSREDRLSYRRPEKTKYGSFQEYVEGFVPFTEVFEQEKDQLPLVEFQLLIVLDVIIGNTDRNTGNILVGEEKLAAIDHGLSFPDTHLGLSYWYWDLERGKKALIPSLIELLTHFPYEPLMWKLNKNCFISLNSLSCLRERVTLFKEAILAGLVPAEIIDLMKPDYLYPIKDYKETLSERAREQVELFKAKR